MGVRKSLHMVPCGSSVVNSSTHYTIAISVVWLEKKFLYFGSGGEVHHPTILGLGLG